MVGRGAAAARAQGRGPRDLRAPHGHGPGDDADAWLPSPPTIWARVAPALAQGHSLLLFDFLGFSASEKPSSTTTRCSSRRTWSGSVGGTRDHLERPGGPRLCGVGGGGAAGTPRERSARDRAVRPASAQRRPVSRTCIARCPPRRAAAIRELGPKLSAAITPGAVHRGADGDLRRGLRPRAPDGARCGRG